MAWPSATGTALPICLAIEVLDPIQRQCRSPATRLHSKPAAQFCAVRYGSASESQVPAVANQYGSLASLSTMVSGVQYMPLEGVVLDNATFSCCIPKILKLP